MPLIKTSYAQLLICHKLTTDPDNHKYISVGIFLLLCKLVGLHFVTILYLLNDLYIAVQIVQQIQDSDLYIAVQIVQQIKDSDICLSACVGDNSRYLIAKVDKPWYNYLRPPSSV